MSIGWHSTLAIDTFHSNECMQCGGDVVCNETGWVLACQKHAMHTLCIVVCNAQVICKHLAAAHNECMLWAGLDAIINLCR
jgi:hypothetical protein